MPEKKSYIYPLVIIGILFFVFGFITWVNGILIPYFKICLELTNFQSLFVAFAAYIAYFFMSLPASKVLYKTGYKNGMVIGLVVMALGTLLFIPAAYTRMYPLFLAGLFITGAGLVLLQNAANPYVAIIGPRESTAQRVGFMGLSNKTAGILSQRIIGGIFLLNADAVIEKVNMASATEKENILSTFALRVITPYLVITFVLLLLALMIYFSKLPEIKEEEEPGTPANKEAVKKNIFSFPHLILGAVALFFAGACEVIPVDGIILYSQSLGLSISESRHFSEYTLYAMLLGYLASIILIPKYLSQRQALVSCGMAGIILCIGVFTTHGIVSIYLMIAMGFISAWLWGTIWGLAIQRLGNFTKLGSAVLLMAVVGGALFPLLFGYLIDLNKSYPQTAVLMLVPCYFVLILYARYWSKKLKW